MSINKGTFHKIWSRLCLVWSSAMQKARILLGEMHVGREIGREPDKAVRAIRLQSKSAPKLERGRGDWMEASWTAIQSKECSARSSAFSSQGQPSEGPCQPGKNKTLSATLRLWLKAAHGEYGLSANVLMNFKTVVRFLGRLQLL